MYTLRISQSFTKAVVNQCHEIDRCPRYVFETYISKIAPSRSSLNMLRGQYFETGVIGETVTGEGVYDLPLAKGKKSAVTQRIDEQIENAKNVLDSFGFTREFTQTALHLPYNDKYYFEGVADIAFEVFEGRPAIIDLKLTESLDANYGKFAWGFGEPKGSKMCDVVYALPSQYDPLQNQLYLTLANNENTQFIYNGQVIPAKLKDWVFCYLVFEREKHLRWRMFVTELTPSDVCELRERTRLLLSDIPYIIKNHSKELPNKDRCKICSVLNCKSRKII